MLSPFYRLGKGGLEKCRNCVQETPLKIQQCVYRCVSPACTSPWNCTSPINAPDCSSPTDQTPGDVLHRRIINFAHQEQHVTRKPANGRTHQADNFWGSDQWGCFLSLRSLDLVCLTTSTVRLQDCPICQMQLSDSGPYPLLGSRQPAAPRHALQPSTDPLPTDLANTLPRGINTGQEQGPADSLGDIT